MQLEFIEDKKNDLELEDDAELPIDLNIVLYRVI